MCNRDVRAWWGKPIDGGCNGCDAREGVAVIQGRGVIFRLCEPCLQVVFRSLNSLSHELPPPSCGIQRVLQSGDALNLRVIVRAGDIPSNSQVTKVKGKKVYTIASELRFFASDKGVEGLPNISSSKDVRFLVSGHDINIIAIDHELVWITDLDQLNMLADA